MLALVVDVPSADVEVAADALWALGVVAVEERTGTDGRTELWTSLGDDRDGVLAAVDGFPARWLVRAEHVADEVVDTWRAFARPTWIDDSLVIRPAWVEASFEPGVSVIDIEPGATFGMGDHPTTILSLRALRRCLRDAVPRRVLDVGCGSGVLAIAAATLGATVADGIDISPAAEVITAANAARNGVADRVSASTEPLQHVDGPYDLVLANILAPTLIDLSDDLLRVLADDGTLIISGILRERHDHVLDSLRPLHVQHVDEMDGWVAVTLRR